ncbi:MAG TPA: hypothetical protein VMS93_06105 [Candidatus Saccharimonadales bacterium]|nr:hypothetical protein [Candidatus Saccharimonadales bacterium]
MRTPLRTPGRSPRVIYLLLAAGLAAAAFGALSCRQVSDPAAAVALNDADQTVSQCIDQCNAAAALRVQQQLKVHNIMIFLCKGDGTCLANETTRFSNALQIIETDRLACIAQCHHQGEATAGR